MTKISVVIYYWLLIAATLLFVRTAGLDHNNRAVIGIVIAVSLLYAAVVAISLSKGRKQAENSTFQGQKTNTADRGAKKKKKHK